MKKITPFLLLITLLSNMLICKAVINTNEQDKYSIDQNLVQFPEAGIPVLMYHSIGTKYHCSVCVSEKQFREEVEWLYNHGYHTLNLDQFYEALSGDTSLPDNPILITFDDGFSDNYKVAWPILKQYGYNATFFIVTGQVNPYNIDWDELKELVNKGNSIGSHTIEHSDLTKLSTKQQEKELRESKEALEKNLDISIKAFCFPFGKYNKTTLDLLPELGYSLSFTTTSGKVHLGDNEYLLNRIHVWGGMASSQFIEKVSYN